MVIYIFGVQALAYGRIRVPMLDQWTLGLYIAVKTQRGDLTFPDLLVSYLGHRHFFHNVYIAFSTALADWQPQGSVYLLLGVVFLKFGLVIWLFREALPQIWHWTLLPLALLLFAYNQLDASLYLATQIWHLLGLFLGLGLMLISTQPVGWRAFGGVALCASAATLTTAAGVVTWGAFALALWLAGYRRWQYMAGWMGLICIAAPLYAYRLDVHPPMTTPLSEHLQQVALGDPFLMIRAALGYLGNPLLFINQFRLSGLHEILGLFSSGVMAGNLIYLWRRVPPRALAVWLGMAAFALGNGVLLVFGRAHIAPTLLLEPRFIQTALWWWVALLGLTGLSALHLTAPTHTLHRTLYAMNMITIGVIVGLYLPVSVLFAHYQPRPYPFTLNPASQDTALPYTQQVLDFPLYRQSLPELATSEAIYQLAVYRLSVFAEEEAVNILPENYQAGDTIIINTPSRWLNLYIREFMLAGMPETEILHIGYPEEFITTDTFPRPLDGVWSAFDEAMLREVDEQRVWYITVPERAETDALIQAAMAQRGYEAQPSPVTTAPYATAHFSLYLFEKE